MFDFVTWVDANIERAKPSAGHEWTGECPYCGRYGGFYVNCDPDSQGPWVCFKCDERSNSIVKLIMHVEDLTFPEAQALVFRNKVEFRRRETTTTLLERIKWMRDKSTSEDFDAYEDDNTEGDLPPEFVPIWCEKTGKWRVPVYLLKRGYKRQTLKEWGVGYCNSGRYAHRVIIPLVCPNGYSFTARDVTGEQMPKYLNPKGVDHRKLLFGWNRAPEHSDFTLVEGPLDALKNDQNRLPSMAIGGKVLHLEQLNMLFKRPRNVAVTVMLDPEATAEAYGVASQLIVHFAQVYVAQLPESIDPGDATRRQAHKAHGQAKRFTGEREKKVNAAIKKAKANLAKRFG